MTPLVSSLVCFVGCDYSYTFLVNFSFYKTIMSSFCIILHQFNYSLIILYHPAWVITLFYKSERKGCFEEICRVGFTPRISDPKQRRRKKYISRTNTSTRACTRRAGFSTRSVSLWGFWRDAVAAKVSSGGRHPWLLYWARICLPRLVTTYAADHQSCQPKDREQKKGKYCTSHVCYVHAALP
jgi:hypothetical protein